MTSKLVVEGNLKLQSGMHIGTGMMNSKTDAAVIRDHKGNPYIPGSSLKGVFRTAAEQLYEYTRTSENHKPVCFLETGNGETGNCNENQQLRETMNKLQDKKQASSKGTSVEAEMEEAVEQGVCPICLLFGSVFKASKLTFSDAYLEGDTLKTEIRHNTAIDRDTGTAKEGARFDYEVVPPGENTAFPVKITGDGITKEEMRILLAVLNEFAEGRIALGGKTTRGLGRVKLQDTKLKKYDLGENSPEEKAAYLRFILGKEKRESLKLHEMIEETFAL
jgi:CRISPR-associated protein Csm3